MRLDRLLRVVGAAAAAFIAYDYLIYLPRRARLFDLEVMSYHAAQSAPNPVQIDPIIAHLPPFDLERAVATTFLYTGGSDLFNWPHPHWDTKGFIFLDKNQYGLKAEQVDIISQWLLSFNQIVKDTSKPTHPGNPAPLYHLTPEGLDRYVNLRRDLARHSTPDCVIPEQMATPLLTDYFVGKRILSDQPSRLENLFCQRA